MTGERPTILVVDGDPDELGAIAAMLREAGFAVVATCDPAQGASARGYFTAAVVALPNGATTSLHRRLRRGQPKLKVLSLVEPAAMRVAGEDDGTLLPRPLDLHRLLGSVFALVLGEDHNVAAPYHRGIAELAIAAAKLACLDHRHNDAAAAGASGLVRDLARQIGETRAVHHALAAATASIPAAAD